MAGGSFGGREIRIVNFDDASVDEHVIEFVDPAVSATDAVLVVFSRGSGWSDARVSTSPKIDGVSVEFMRWALDKARDRM